MVRAGLAPATSEFQVSLPLRKNKNLLRRPCCTQAKYYLRHCKKCPRGKHNLWADSFTCDLVVSQANQKNMKMQEGIIISLRYHVNRPLGITKLTRALPSLVHSTSFEYRSNYSNYGSVKGLLAKSAKKIRDLRTFAPKISHVQIFFKTLAVGRK